MTFWTFYVDRGEGAKLRIWVTQRDPGGDPQFLIDEFLKWKLTVGVAKFCGSEGKTLTWRCVHGYDAFALVCEKTEND